MLLAGGQGSRLYVLTKNVAKPAGTVRRQIPHYRFSPFQLRKLRHRDGGCAHPVRAARAQRLHRLGPDVGTSTACAAASASCLRISAARLRSGTKGTANAIYQNIPFIADYDPEYVLILSGDHIYKMDYTKMLRQHKETGADATIAVLDVPLSEASRFGIMNCKPDGTIYEFEEKPKEPKSTLASMGIYIFSWKKLRKYLEEDEANSKSSNDFGKDIIPAMLANGEKMVSLPLRGLLEGRRHDRQPVGGEHGPALSEFRPQPVGRQLEDLRPHHRFASALHRKGREGTAYSAERGLRDRGGNVFRVGPVLGRQGREERKRRILHSDAGRSR